MARGTVSKFDVSRGYGLIRPDQSKTEIFVHGSSVTVAADPPLSLGQIVYYEVLTGPHGSQAIAVRPAKGVDAAEQTAS